jgi:hypothetical protein
LHDPNFLDLHPYRTASKATLIAASLFTTAKKAFQKAAERTLTRKATTGDLAPKPTSNVVLTLVEEGASMAMKAGPVLLRMANSPASLTLGFATCALVLLLDDTTRNMAMDQITQLMAIFQNEAAESKSDNNKTPKIEP